MRKQTKVVAVASAAALLAIGASMTSFAATGWVEEDGTWYFYDNDGNRVEDAWKKSGENWYWLDGEEGGAMAMEKIVEDDDDIYYVDANGVMVRNTWVKVVNEDQDEDEDPAEYHYYYMQSNGKAYKASDNNNAIRFRTIDGKRYAFDDDGKMLYGWVSEDGERLSDDDGWESATYYLGNWDEGDMKIGWQKIYVYDGDEDDDMEHWFNFKSNGKKRDSKTTDNPEGDNAVKEEKINGKKYGFDHRGVMVYEWTVATKADATRASSSSWKYFGSAEDGARVTKGWFKVVAPSEDNDNVFKTNYGSGDNDTFAKEDADDENERWYYADGDGNLEVGKIKKIKGKYYGFRPEGDSKAAAMLSGLVLLEVDPSNGDILHVFDDGVDSDELSDLLDWNRGRQSDSDSAYPAIVQTIIDNVEYPGYYANVSLYYFGDEETDGAMKTGATTVTIDGESYNFLFNKTGGAESKGKGLTGLDDNKYIYKFGCRIKAGSDDKYQVVEVVPGRNNATDIHGSMVWVNKLDSAWLKTLAGKNFTNDKNESVTMLRIPKAQAEDESKWYLVNTSGNVQKSKVAAKDGDDWYFYVKDREVLLYTNNKNLDDKDTENKTEKWEDYIINPNINN